MAEYELPAPDYTRYSNRELAAIPLAVLVLAIAVIAGWYLMTGAPVSPGIAFTGGTEVQLTTDASESAIQSAFDTQPESIAPVRGQDSYVLTFQSTDTAQITQNAQAIGEVGSVQGTSASFGGDVQRLTILGIVTAFVGMSLLVFVLFRTFVPSIAVVISAFSDIVIPIAAMNLLGIQLSLGTVAALLMLIGYSVDSDLLLNNHVLRRSGGFYESTYRAMRTGVTMTLTSISAMAVMAIVAWYYGVDLLQAVGTVLVIGLVADLMNTYLLNLSLLRWYKYEGVAR